MEILSVGTSFPGDCHSQDSLVAELANAWAGRATSKEIALLLRLAKSAGVESKHLAMAPEDYAKSASFTERNNRYIAVAEKLAATSIQEACDASGVSLAEIDAIFFTTVTGVAVPSIDARLVGILGLRQNVKRIPMFGLGCVAGAAGLARMHDYLQGYPHHTAVLVAVELCSLTLQMDDLSPQNIVAAALFGDGAAAVIGVGAKHRLAAKSPLRTICSVSRVYPNSDHIMGWDIGAHGFKIRLDPGVAQIVEAYLYDDLSLFLRQQNLELSDIKTWISHPGGPKVLASIETCLGLSKSALEISWSQLKKLGNMSSVSVLSVLKETILMRRAESQKSDHAIIMAMGPGFCLETLLCEWAN